MRDVRFRRRVVLRHRVDVVQVLFGPGLAIDDDPAKPRQRILVEPLGHLRLRHIARIVVLRVTLHAHRVDADQLCAGAVARAVDHALGDVEYSQHVVAVHQLVRDAVRRRALVDARDRHLLRDWRRVRVLVVLGDHDERDALHGCEVQPFVERARARGAVPDPGHRDARLLHHPRPHGDARGDRDRVAEHADRSDDHGLVGVLLRQVDDVDIEIASAGVRRALRHVLAEDLERPHADGHQRAHVADQRQHGVSSIERIGGRDRLPLLAERSIEAADDLALAEQDHEPLFDVARQSREVIHLQKLVRSQSF